MVTKKLQWHVQVLATFFFFLCNRQEKTRKYPPIQKHVSIDIKNICFEIHRITCNKQHHNKTGMLFTHFCIKVANHLLKHHWSNSTKLIYISYDTSSDNKDLKKLQLILAHFICYLFSVSIPPLSHKGENFKLDQYGNTLIDSVLLIQTQYNKNIC